MRIELPFMILSIILFVGIAMSGDIERLFGIALFALLIFFTSWQIRRSRKANKLAEEEEEPVNEKPLWAAILIVLSSFAALVFGANLLVQGASDIAVQLGVSDRLIGLTIVAVGTSLPELFASVMAAKKGETDMAVGNIIGSVTFNILCVIGVSSAIFPIHESKVGFEFDYLFMIGLSLLLWFFMSTKRVLERWEGVVLLLLYVGYVAYTIFRG